MSVINLKNLQEPACFFDKDTFTLMKIGEKKLVKELYDKYLETYLADGQVEMAIALTYVDLPKDQELIDNIFNIAGYCKNLVDLVKEQHS